jgi:hypothetical protein
MKKPIFKNRSKNPIFEFLNHTAVGTIIFMIIAIPAIALSILVDYLKLIQVQAFTIQVLALLEHAILMIDAAFFISYFLISSIKTLKGIYYE